MMILAERTMFFRCILLAYTVFLTGHTYAFEIGVATHFSRYPGTPNHYLDVVENHSFTSFRDGFSWDSIEKNPGEFKISPYNKRLDDLYLNNGSAVSKNSMFVLAYGNKNYTGIDYPRNKEEVDKFVDYVGWIAKRYKGRIKYYEVWNEWFLGTGVAKKTRPSDKIFLYLVEQSAKKIKSIDPDAVVITGSINPIHKDEYVWILNLVKQGLNNYVDGISVHPYSFNERDKGLREPNINFNIIDKFESELSTASGKEIPIYITEMGYPSSEYVKGGVSIQKSSDYIFKYTILARSRAYIKGIWWYDLMDDGKSPFNKEHNFGFFKNNGEPKDSALMINKVIPLLLDEKSCFKGKKDKIDFYIKKERECQKVLYSWNVNNSFSFEKFLIDISSLR